MKDMDILFACFVCQGHFYKKAGAHKASRECTPECHRDFCSMCVSLSVASFEAQMRKARLRLESKTG